MKIRVLTFAQLKDFFEGTFEIEIPSGSTVEELLQSLREQEPKCEQVLSSCRVAIDEEIGGLETILREGAHVAILPPSSGG